MSMDIPGTKRADEELRAHDVEKERHAETVREDENHPYDGTDYHHMKEAEEREQEEFDYIRNKERGTRREEHVEDGELTREANTILEDN